MSGVLVGIVFAGGEFVFRDGDDLSRDYGCLFFSHDDFFRNEILGYLIVEPFRLDQKILENYSYDEWKEIDLFFM